MQSYFPDGPVTATPYAGNTQVPMEPQPIYARKKGGKHEVIATYDAEFRAGFDRKITGWAIDFMTRAHQEGLTGLSSRNILLPTSDDLPC